MSDSTPPANDAEPSPEDDPEIAALLEFEPVPRPANQAAAWTPELQRQLIARLAAHGSKGRACGELGKDRGGLDKLYKSPDGASFRAAFDGAVALFKRRREERIAKEPAPGGKPPTVDLRFKAPSRQPLSRAGREGQILNEYGEWEDEESLHRRAEEARDSIANKLVLARRLYLQEISGCPGKRAAFEILTELPIDWERARSRQPQPDEPWRPMRMREPDMLLTAENGWVAGIGYGPDKVGQLRRDIDAYRASEGLAPVDWDGEQEE